MDLVVYLNGVHVCLIKKQNMLISECFENTLSRKVTGCATACICPFLLCSCWTLLYNSASALNFLNKEVIMIYMISITNLFFYGLVSLYHGVKKVKIYIKDGTSYFICMVTPKGC